MLFRSPWPIDPRAVLISFLQQGPWWWLWWRQAEAPVEAAPSPRWTSRGLPPEPQPGCSPARGASEPLHGFQGALRAGGARFQLLLPPGAHLRVGAAREAWGWGTFTERSGQRRPGRKLPPPAPTRLRAPRQCWQGCGGSSREVRRAGVSDPHWPPRTVRASAGRGPRGAAEWVPGRAGPSGRRGGGHAGRAGAELIKAHGLAEGGGSRRAASRPARPPRAAERVKSRAQRSPRGRADTGASADPGRPHRRGSADPGPGRRSRRKRRRSGPC